MPNFPSSLDSLSNPAASDTTVAVPHHTQHGTANDILEAIEAKIGITPSVTTDSSQTPVVGYELASSQTGSSVWRADAVIDARDYGAFPTSGADELAHIQAAITAAGTLGGAVVKLLPGTYLVSNALLINVDGVILEGAGPDATTIKRTGATAGTVVYIQTTSGNTHKILGAGVRRLSIDGNSVAAYGLRVTTANSFIIEHLYISGCITVQMFMDCWATTSGDARDNQHGLINEVKVTATSSADGLKIDGNAAPDANTSCNLFTNIWAKTVDGNGIIVADADDNVFSLLRMSATGTGKGLLLKASALANGHARHNVFFGVQATSAGVSAESGAVPSGPNYIFGNSLGNSGTSPVPSGSATLYWTNDDGTFDGQLGFPATQRASTDANTLDDYEEGTFTPVLAYATPGNSSWAVTTQLGFYTKIGRLVNFQLSYNGVPTNGTASGNLTFTGLPFTVQNTTGAGARFAVQFQGYTKANFTWVVGVTVLNTSTGLFQASGSAQTTATLAVGDIPTGGTVIVQGAGHFMI